ncbi:MAG: protein-disulfide reductase DsbD domain-containing protein, partial [Pseudomonadota bacterium]
MKRPFCLLFLIFTSIFIGQVATCALPSLSDSPVQLGAQSFEDQGKTYLAITFENQKGWHTYWKNPGDAGSPIKIEFEANGKKVDLPALEWPVPQQFPSEGGLVGLGYQGQYALFYEIPASLLPQWQGKPFIIKARWLACLNICIPGQGALEAQWQDHLLILGRSDLKLDENDLKKSLHELPVAISYPPSLTIDWWSPTPNKFQLLANFKGEVKGINERLGLLTPFPHPWIKIYHENLRQDAQSNLYSEAQADWVGLYQEPEVLLKNDGTFPQGFNLSFLYNDPTTGKISIIEKSFPQFFFSPDDPWASLRPNLKDYSPFAKELPLNPSIERSLFLYLLLAFIGGLILNVMPCVLPVISLKMFALLRSRDHSHQHILLRHLFYSLGILLSFLCLAIIIILSKSAGQHLGWGFQLQSPHFIAVMMIALYLFALNLFGLFEFPVPGGRFLGAIPVGQGYTGELISGVIATILATPCTAPFLGTALTFAFSTSVSMATTLLIFSFIALGLSSPFLIIGLFPNLITFLPKPGKWMLHLKKILAVALLLTVLWAFSLWHQIHNPYLGEWPTI